MTVLVFGKTGQLGAELARLDGATCLGRDLADLADPAGCAAAIRQHAPRAVINAAAYTAVDAAETDEPRATAINGTAPGMMAETCAGLGIPFVSVSTDYVFSGAGQAPWTPADTPDPVNAYGRSKLAGEQAIAAAGGIWAVIRTSWVVSAHGQNFVKTMLRLGRERDRLGIVADQIGGPTPAAALAQAALAAARGLATDASLGGIYHVSGGPDVSWADVARETFAQAGIACAVDDIPSSAYPTPARRPLNSRLDNSSFTAAFGLERPDWRIGLADILKDLGET